MLFSNIFILKIFDFSSFVLSIISINKFNVFLSTRFLYIIDSMYIIAINNNVLGFKTIREKYNYIIV